MTIALLVHSGQHLRLIPKYTQTLKGEQLAEFNASLKLKLKRVYIDDEICSWIVENLNRLTEPTVALADLLDKNYE
jgi:hypothetical protein